MHSFILWNSQFQSLRLYLNLCSMIHVYAYTDSKHSATPMSIESKYYTSDANGNQDSIPNIERRMYWDEDNRLMVLSDNGKTSRYTYKAAEKIWKNLSGNDEHHDLIRRSPKLPGAKLYYKTVSELIGQNKKLKSIFNDASKYYKKHY